MEATNKKETRKQSNGNVALLARWTKSVLLLPFHPLSRVSFDFLLALHIPDPFFWGPHIFYTWRATWRRSARERGRNFQAKNLPPPFLTYIPLAQTFLTFAKPGWDTRHPIKISSHFVLNFTSTSSRWGGASESRMCCTPNCCSLLIWENISKMSCLGADSYKGRTKKDWSFFHENGKEGKFAKIENI